MISNNFLINFDNFSTRYISKLLTLAFCFQTRQHFLYIHYKNFENFQPQYCDRQGFPKGISLKRRFCLDHINLLPVRRRVKWCLFGFEDYHFEYSLRMPGALDRHWSRCVRAMFRLLCRRKTLGSLARRGMSGSHRRVTNHVHLPGSFLNACSSREVRFRGIREQKSSTSDRPVVVD